MSKPGKALAGETVTPVPTVFVPAPLAQPPLLKGAEPAAEERPPESGDGAEKNFPIVGIGASAGGLEAFAAFFTHLPEASGCGFVLVQHMDAIHRSILPELIQRHTSLPVLQVSAHTPILPNAIYVIPPNHQMELANGILQLLEGDGVTGCRFSIDHFLRSLAKDQKENAACVILSGTGSDGTLGLAAIKEVGGLVLVQEPASAKFDGMPVSAANTGLADFILPPEQMPLVLMEHFERRAAMPSRPVVALPREEGGGRDQLQTIFTLLRAQSGHDFSLYKENAILRRVERRMAVHKIEGLNRYITFLQNNREEVMALFRDLLIRVSNFFRDPAAFAALEEKVIPSLFENRPAGKAIRVWVPGCASGEEAYTLAILLQEQMLLQGREYPVQIFATDIDDRAIQIVRKGLYPATIAADLTEDRLNRFFTREGDSFKANKVLREMLVVAVQNLVKDPPFSNLDLISCRNLMIYMKSALQQKVLSIFHYALNPGRFLLLGTSETIGGEEGFAFGVIDKKWKIYQRNALEHVRTPFIPSTRSCFATFPLETKALSTDQKLSPKNTELKEMVARFLLEEHAPTCLMINDQNEIMYIHGKTGMFLEASSGEAHWNVIKLAREGLALELAAALRSVKFAQQPVRHEGLQVKTNGGEHRVNLMVTPILFPETMNGWSWVVLEDKGAVSTAAGKKASPKGGNKHGKRRADLEKELYATRANLKRSIEELESFNEELKSMNEELQAANEELQSANEELETAREESQSVNEELSTINAEYEEKLIHLAKANNDIVNLLASTDIGIIFLDQELNVLRFTPSATRFIRLIPGDVGRPLRHLVSDLSEQDLSRTAERVMETLIPQQFDAQTRDGHWFSIRVRPYRTVDNIIEGVVIAFFDIDETRKLERLAKRSQAYAESIVHAVRDSLLVLDGSLRVISVNRSFLDRFQQTEKELVGRFLYELDQGAWNHPELRRLLCDVLPARKGVCDFTLEGTFTSLGRRTLLLNACQMVTELEEENAILLTIHDVMEERACAPAPVLE